MAFFKNQNGKIWTYNGKCLISPRQLQTAPISTGGRFILPDGDVLVIGPQWDEKDIPHDWCVGITFHLESGAECSAYYSIVDYPNVLQSGFGVIDFGCGDDLYTDGNMLRIYKGYTYEIDNIRDESLFRDMGLEPIIILEIVDGTWKEIKKDPYHQTIAIASETFDLYWNQATNYGSLGLSIDNSSGEEYLYFYWHDGNWYHSSYSMFYELSLPIMNTGDELMAFNVQWYDLDVPENINNSEELLDLVYEKGYEPILNLVYDEEDKWVEQ